MGRIFIIPLLCLSFLSAAAYGRDVSRKNKATQTQTEKKSHNNSISDEKIKNYADQQARTVANNIAATYGRQEQYKNSFVKGLHAGSAGRRNASNDSSYSKGYQEGLHKAKAEGNEAGIQAAREDARNQAEQNVRKQYEQAVYNKSFDPHAVVTVPAHLFSASRVSAKVLDISARMKTTIDGYQKNLIPVFSKIHFDVDGSEFIFQIGDHFSLYSWLDLRGSYPFVERYFNGDFAFDEWRNNRLAGRYDYNIFNKLDHVQQHHFTRVFKSVFNQVIADKIEKKKSKDNQESFDLGYEYGQKIAAKKAYFQGLEDGYSQNLGKTASDSYNREFPSAYLKAFRKKSDFYVSHSVLKFNFAVSMLHDQSGNAGYLAIQGKVTNIGGKPAYNQKILISSEYFRAEDNSFFIDFVDAYNNKTLSFTTPIRISKKIIANQIYPVALIAPDQTHMISISFSFADLVNLYVRAEEPGVRKSLRESIVATIMEEWDQNSGIFQTDIYKMSLSGSRKSSYLGQLVSYKETRYPELSELHYELSNHRRFMASLKWNKDKHYHALVDLLRD